MIDVGVFVIHTVEAVGLGQLRTLARLIDNQIVLCCRNGDGWRDTRSPGEWMRSALNQIKTD